MGPDALTHAQAFVLGVLALGVGCVLIGAAIALEDRRPRVALSLAFPAGAAFVLALFVLAVWA